MTRRARKRDFQSGSISEFFNNICALLPLLPHRRMTKIHPPRHARLQRSYFFIKVGRLFQPQLRARLDAEADVAPDRRATAAALTHPSSRSTDGGRASRPEFERDRRQGRHQVRRIAAPIEQRVLANSRSASTSRLDCALARSSKSKPDAEGIAASGPIAAEGSGQPRNGRQEPLLGLSDPVPVNSTPASLDSFSLVSQVP